MIFHIMGLFLRSPYLIFVFFILELQLIMPENVSIVARRLVKQPIKQEIVRRGKQEENMRSNFEDSHLIIFSTQSFQTR